MNKIYLAGRYSRRAELAEYAEVLKRMGNCITSTWLDGTHEADDKAPTMQQKSDWARADLMDIRKSDMFLAFTDNTQGRGGRHFECGYAASRQIPIYTIGDTEDNIFYANLDNHASFSVFLSIKWGALING